MTSQALARPGRPRAGFRLLLAFDVVIVFGLLALGPHTVLGAEQHRWPQNLLLVGLVVPLILRRRVPVTAFAVIAAIAFVQWFVAEPAVADAALLVAFYGVARSAPRRYVLAAGAVLELGVVLAVLRYTPSHGAHSLSFVFLSGLVVAAGVLGWTVRVRTAYLNEVEQRAARLELERDQQAQLAVAAERARVAREMHDVVAHNVSVMVALTDGAALILRSDPNRAAIALGEASRAGRAALTDMRRVLGVLRDSDDAAALAPAPGLADLAELLAAVRHTGLDVRYTTSGPIADLEPGLQLSAFRIVQEAVTNTLKHATRASTLDVSVAAGDTGVEVSVRDDGRAADSAPSGTSGHGIVGMRERAAVHSGAVHAGRTPTGWLVHAWLPTGAEEPAAAPLAETPAPLAGASA
jgi:signal transduction histidine kinase